MPSAGGWRFRVKAGLQRPDGTWHVPLPGCPPKGGSGEGQALATPLVLLHSREMKFRDVLRGLPGYPASSAERASGRPVAASWTVAPREASFWKKLGKVFFTQDGFSRRMPGTRRASMAKHMAMRWSL